MGVEVSRQNAEKISMFAALGTTVISLGLLLIAVSVPLCFAGLGLVWWGKRSVSGRREKATTGR